MLIPNFLLVFLTRKACETSVFQKLENFKFSEYFFKVKRREYLRFSSHILRLKIPESITPGITLFF